LKDFVLRCENSRSEEMEVDEDDMNEIPENTNFNRETSEKKKTNIYTVKTK
jgi:hypothetical protein